MFIQGEEIILKNDTSALSFFFSSSSFQDPQEMSLFTNRESKREENINFQFIFRPSKKRGPVAML